MESQQKTRTQVLTARLYDAAIDGDVNCLINLLEEDPLVLDRCIIEKSDRFEQSPLYVAVNLGHVEFTKAILDRKPELTEELNQFSKTSSALHMAVIKGYLSMVKELVAKNSNICFTKDQNGQNPVHVAAIRGKIDELKELILANPQVGRERTSGGDTVLHLCVKHRQPSSLEFLVNANDDCNLLNSKDNDGNSILHLAVIVDQLRMVQFLVKKPKLEKNATSESGFTAMDLAHQSKNETRKGEIWKALRLSKACRAKDIKIPKNNAGGTNINNWLERQRNALMVVASLIATMAFQVGVNPPGGVWQDNKFFDVTIGSYNQTAGASVMATLEEDQYKLMIVSNTIGLASSLSVILLLISGLPCQRFFVFILMIIMWVAITATTFTYLFSVAYLTDFPSSPNDFINVVVNTSYAWLGLIMILSIVHGIRIILWLIKHWIWKPITKRVQLITKLSVRGCRSFRSETHPPV